MTSCSCQSPEAQGDLGPCLQRLERIKFADRIACSQRLKQVTNIANRTRPQRRNWLQQKPVHRSLP